MKLFRFGAPGAEKPAMLLPDGVAPSCWSLARAKSFS